MKKILTSVGVAALALVVGVIISHNKKAKEAIYD